jgi:type IV secretion system protein VirB6
MDAPLVGNGVMECLAPTTGNVFLSGVLGYIDCQTAAIGSSGYQSLASPGSTASLVLTGLLTIFVAIHGVKMLMGRQPDGSDLVASVVKIGIVLVLASSWAAYRVIAYDLVLQGPVELVEGIGQSAGLVGSDGGLVVRLQGMDNAITLLTQAGSGRLDIASAALPGQPIVAATPISDDLAFGTARIAYLGSTIGALGLIRLAAGLMLALAPLFAGLLLFQATRGLFEGWARLLVATVIGSVGVSVVLAVQLGLLEPWFADVLARRTVRVATPAAPGELLVITLAFAFISFAVIALALRVAFTTHIPAWSSRLQIQWPEQWSKLIPLSSHFGRSIDAGLLPDEQTTRAKIISDSLAANLRREGTISTDSVSRAASVFGKPREDQKTAPERPLAYVPVGEAYRRTRSRPSGAANRRSNIS